MYLVLCPLLLASTLAFETVRICPIRKCDSCLDRRLQVVPGVGIHLGLTSGAVAISHSNGSIEDVAYIPGSHEYVSLMQYLPKHSDRLGLPPMDTFSQRMQYVRPELKRRFNLMLGLAGSPISYTLGTMLKSLRSKAESHLSKSVTAIDLALPGAASLSINEINDALAYVGLKKLDGWQLPEGEINSAYAAYGHGLCSSYTDPYQCEAEEAELQENRVLHLDFTNKSLSATGHRMRTARNQYSSLVLLDWGLGRENSTHSTIDTEYWGALKSRIQDLAPSKDPYTKLLVTGEAANDESFLEILREALWDDELKDQIDSGMNPRFVVARGAAEFQRRRQRGWLDCVQTNYCKQTTIWGKVKARYDGLFDIW